MSTRGRGRGGRGGATRGGRASPVDLSDPTAVVQTEDGEIDVETNGDIDQTSSRGGRGGGRGGRGGSGAVRKPRQYKPLKVVPEPDTAGHNAALNAHNAKLADINKQIESFTTKIESLVKSRKVVRASVKTHTETLDNIRQTKQSHFSEYDRLKSEIENIDNQSIHRKKELETLKKSLGAHNSLADIDNAIKQKEKLLNSRTLQLSQERQALDELKQLRAIRPKLIEFDKKSQEVTVKIDTAELASQRDAAFNAGHACKSSEDAAVAALAAESKKEEQISSELDGLIAQRRTLINERQNQERNWLSVLDEFNALTKVYEVYRKEKDWRDNEDARRAQSQKEFEQRQARREAKMQQKLDWAQRKNEWEEEQARIEAERDPFEEEKQIVDDLTRYLSALAIKYNVVIEDDANGSAEADNNAQQAAQLAAERAAAFGGKSVKPLEKTAKKDSAIPELVAKKQTEKKASKPKQAKVLSHVTDVFRLFSRISVDPPVLSSDINSALKSILAKGDYYATAPRPVKKGKAAQSAEEETEEAEEEADAEVVEEEEEDVQITHAEQ